MLYWECRTIADVYISGDLTVICQSLISMLIRLTWFFVDGQPERHSLYWPWTFPSTWSCHIAQAFYDELCSWFHAFSMDIFIKIYTSLFERGVFWQTSSHVYTITNTKLCQKYSDCTSHMSRSKAVHSINISTCACLHDKDTYSPS